MTLAERLKAAIAESGRTQVNIAKMAGLSPTALNKIVIGKSQSSKKIIEIANALGVSPVWLAQGVGPMKSGTTPAMTAAEDGYQLSNVIGSMDVPVTVIEGIDCIGMDGRIIDQTKIIRRSKLNKEQLRDFGVNSESAELISTTITDDNLSPRIPEKSVVTIDISDKKLSDGKLYLIEQNGWLRFKSLHRTGANQLTLKSFDPQKFPDEVAELTDVNIVGRVVMTVSPV